MSDRLWRAREVAERLDLSVETVLRWTRRGVLPGYRISTGALRYDEAELEVWLAKRATAAPVREAPTSLADAAERRLSSTAPTSPPLDAATTAEEPSDATR